MEKRRNKSVRRCKQTRNQNVEAEKKKNVKRLKIEIIIIIIIAERSEIGSTNEWKRTCAVDIINNEENFISATANEPTNQRASRPVPTSTVHAIQMTQVHCVCVCVCVHSRALCALCDLTDQSIIYKIEAHPTYQLKQLNA